MIVRQSVVEPVQTERGARPSSVAPFGVPPKASSSSPPTSLLWANDACVLDCASLPRRSAAKAGPPRPLLPPSVFICLPRHSASARRRLALFSPCRASRLCWSSSFSLLRPYHARVLDCGGCDTAFSCATQPAYSAIRNPHSEICVCQPLPAIRGPGIRQANVRHCKPMQALFKESFFCEPATNRAEVPSCGTKAGHPRPRFQKPLEA
jgi:hypothetical protein